MPNAEPNNAAFVDAMKAVAQSNTPDTRRTLYETMLNSTFILPVTANGNPGMRTYQRGEKISIITLQTADQKVVWPVFTELDTLHKWKVESSHYCSISATDLFWLANQHHIDFLMINPAGPYGGQIAEWEITYLAQGIIPDLNSETLTTHVLDHAHIKADTPSNDSHPSPEMIRVINDVLSGYSQVEAGYVFLMAIDPLPPQLVLGVRFYEIPDKQIKDTTMRELSQTINGRLNLPQKLGLIVLTDKLLEMAQSNTKPVFQR